jgi:alkylated DNA repair dioxygenase AlkB
MQATLFGGGAPRLGSLRHGQRHELGHGAWVEHVPDAVAGHEQLFEHVREHTVWEARRRQMYEREVAVPRLLAQEVAPHGLWGQLQERLASRTGWWLDRVTAAYYRDGRDSVAWHGDRMGELRRDCVMAIVSLGAPRRFLLRPAGGGPSRCLPLRGGDLLVLGGSIHERFDHSVPKERHAGPRIAVMFRPTQRP